jgi:hypothetical protein
MNSYSITYLLTYNEESDAYVKFASFGWRLFMFSSINYTCVSNISLEFMYDLSGVENGIMIPFHGCKSKDILHPSPAAWHSTAVPVD